MVIIFCLQSTYKCNNRMMFQKVNDGQFDRWSLWRQDSVSRRNRAEDEDDEKDRVRESERVGFSDNCSSLIG